MVVRNEQQELQGWVLADGISVDLLRKEENGSFFGFFIDLIACYYGWDLAYPHCHVILHFFQDYVVKDIHDFQKSSAYKIFEKQYLNTL